MPGCSDDRGPTPSRLVASVVQAMSGWWLGAMLGVVASIGVLLAVRAAPPMRPIRLDDRVAPYLLDAPAPSRLLARPSAGSEPFAVIRKLFGPTFADAVRRLDRLVGGSESVRRRLRGLGLSTAVEEFRIEQMVWGACGMVGGAVLLGVLTVLRGAIDPVLIGAGAVIGGGGGVLARDWWLTNEVRRRERRMLAEFPIVADLFALAVLAGEAPVEAMQRVCRLISGELTSDLQKALDGSRSGQSITVALSELSDGATLGSFRRFLDGLVVAIERGTPLAEVLRAQAADVREQSNRALLEAGGQKELQMMVPVVFMILPVTVLFALYPGLLTLVSMSQ
jgi:tight adherence protein C